MSAEIVNLRRTRKRKARESQAESAAANRALHGRPPSERELDRARAVQQKRELDGKKLEK